MRVVVAPDGFGGTLSAVEAARAIAAGWRRVRAEDDLVEVPLSDGGEGLIEVVSGAGDRLVDVEVAGPLGRPVIAGFLLRDDGTAVVESARACGPGLVPIGRLDPVASTTYGVGQLLRAAAESGAERVLVGLGGSATIDGGAGALLAMGFRIRRADGSGLKVGGGELVNVDRVDADRREVPGRPHVTVLADVTSPLLDAPRVFGPQKGADPAAVSLLERALERWADVAERDLSGGERVRELPGTGAAGGLGFGLTCGIGAAPVTGIEEVAALVGLDTALEAADLVVTGEGRLDATSALGKVVGAVIDRARAAGVPVMAVVGRTTGDAPVLDAVEAAAPAGPGPEPDQEVRAAAARLAGRI